MLRVCVEVVSRWAIDVRVECHGEVGACRAPIVHGSARLATITTLCARTIGGAVSSRWLRPPAQLECAVHVDAVPAHVGQGEGGERKGSRQHCAGRGDSGGQVGDLHHTLEPRGLRGQVQGLRPRGGVHLDLGLQQPARRGDDMPGVCLGVTLSRVRLRRLRVAATGVAGAGPHRRPRAHHLVPHTKLLRVGVAATEHTHHRRVPGQRGCRHSQVRPAAGLHHGSDGFRYVDTLRRVVQDAVRGVVHKDARLPNASRQDFTTWQHFRQRIVVCRRGASAGTATRTARGRCVRHGQRRLGRRHGREVGDVAALCSHHQLHQALQVGAVQLQATSHVAALHFDHSVHLATDGCQFGHVDEACGVRRRRRWAHLLQQPHHELKAAGTASAQGALGKLHHRIEDVHQVLVAEERRGAGEQKVHQPHAQLQVVASQGCRVGQLQVAGADRELVAPLRRRPRSEPVVEAVALDDCARPSCAAGKALQLVGALLVLVEHQRRQRVVAELTPAVERDRQLLGSRDVHAPAHVAHGVVRVRRLHALTRRRVLSAADEVSHCLAR